jgi:hypothetical protein
MPAPLTPRRVILALALPSFLIGSCAFAIEPPCAEDFADVLALATEGWSIVNVGDPARGTAWHQGNASVFPSWEGDPNAYAAVDMHAIAEWPGIVSVWLVTPMIDFGPNSISARALDFHARALRGAANRLVVRQCLASSDEVCDVPASGLGGFTTTLIEINRDLLVDGFPDAWEHFVATPADGLATIGVGRIAFHYSIPVQPDGSHGTYLGLDSVTMTGATTCPFGEIVFENGFD